MAFLVSQFADINSKFADINSKFDSKFDEVNSQLGEFGSRISMSELRLTQGEDRDQDIERFLDSREADENLDDKRLSALSIATEDEDKKISDAKVGKRKSQDARKLKSNRALDFDLAADLECDEHHTAGLLDSEEDESGERQALHPDSRKSMSRRTTNQAFANYGSEGSKATSAVKAAQRSTAKKKARAAAIRESIAATPRDGSDPDGSDSSTDSDSSSDRRRWDGPSLPRPKVKKMPQIFRTISTLWAAMHEKPLVLQKQFVECKTMIHHGGLAHVAKQIKEISRFMEVEQQRVSVTKILSDDFKEHLKLKYGLTATEFVTMTMEELFPFLAAETVVLNSARFYEEMEHALQGYPVKSFTGVTALTHQSFYYSQLNFIANFKVLLSIMLTTNSQHVPSTDTREGGLVRLFRDNTDTKYANTVIASMKNRKWSNMGAFLAEYQAACLEHFQLSQTARQLPYDTNKLDVRKDQRQVPSSDSKGHHRSDSRGNDVRDHRGDSRGNDGGNEVRNPHSDPRGQPWDRARRVSYDRDRPKTWTKPPNRDLSSVHTDQYDPHADSGDDNYFHRHDRHDSEGYDTEPEDYSWRKDLVAGRSPLDIQRIIETTVSAMQGAERAAQDDFGCLKKIMHGTCTGKNCTFLHTDEAMTKTAKEIGGKCSSYLANGLPAARPSATQPTAILSRTHQGSRS
jgi:hypothetical protein